MGGERRQREPPGLLAVLSGPGAPLFFYFRQRVCGRGLGGEGACVPQPCARVRGIVSSPFVLHTHAQREAVRHYKVLVGPGILEVHA